jgi:hypothetical protein
MIALFLSKNGEEAVNREAEEIQTFILCHVEVVFRKISLPLQISIP